MNLHKYLIARVLIYSMKTWDLQKSRAKKKIIYLFIYYVGFLSSRTKSRVLINLKFAKTFICIEFGVGTLTLLVISKSVFIFIYLFICCVSFLSSRTKSRVLINLRFAWTFIYIEFGVGTLTLLFISKSVFIVRRWIEVNPEGSKT